MSCISFLQIYWNVFHEVASVLPPTSLFYVVNNEIMKIEVPRFFGSHVVLHFACFSSFRGRIVLVGFSNVRTVTLPIHTKLVLTV